MDHSDPNPSTQLHNQQTPTHSDFEPIAAVLPLVLAAIIQRAEKRQDVPFSSVYCSYRWAA